MGGTPCDVVTEISPLERTRRSRSENRKEDNQRCISRGRLNDEQLDRGLLELRNMPRADGRSPAQILFGHPLRSGSVPMHHRAYAEEWQRAADQCDEKAAEISEEVLQRHDSRSRPLRPLQLGGHVDIQNTETCRWDRSHGPLETFGGPQRHAVAHLKAGKMVIPNMSSVMLGKSVLF